MKKEQAIKIATMLLIANFKASDGQFCGFKTRYNISLQKNNGEAGLVDKEAADYFI